MVSPCDQSTAKNVAIQDLTPRVCTLPTRGVGIPRTWRGGRCACPLRWRARLWARWCGRRSGGQGVDV